VREFFDEVMLAKTIVEEAEKAGRTPRGFVAAYQEEHYNWYIEMLAPVARKNLANRSPFKKWIIAREAEWWSVAHQKLMVFLREYEAGSPVQPDQDAALKPIACLLGKHPLDVWNVVREKDKVSDAVKLTDNRLTVQQVLRQGGGPHRAALRALSRLLGLPESKISDRLRRVFFYKPGEKGDPELKRR
jgi:hypothetical protein